MLVRGWNAAQLPDWQGFGALHLEPPTNQPNYFDLTNARNIFLREVNVVARAQNGDIKVEATHNETMYREPNFRNVVDSQGCMASKPVLLRYRL